MLLELLCLLASLPPLPLPVAPPATVAGRLAHPTARVVTLSYAPDWRGQYARTLAAPVSAAGDFSFQVPALAAPTEARLGYAGRFVGVYLTPGCHLRLRLDARRPAETIRFAGPGAAANEYLARAYRQATQDEAAGRTPEAQAAGQDAAALRRAADRYRQRRFDTLRAYAAHHPALPAAFVRQQRQALAYEWAATLLSYPAAPPAGYYDFLPRLRLAAQGAALGRAALQSLLLTYAYTRLGDAAGRLPAGPGAGERLYRRASADLGTGRVRDAAVGAYLLGKIESEHLDARPLLPAFAAHNHDSTIARAVRRAVRAHLYLLGGTPAPDFTAADTAGRTVALASFRGRVVYLDFWASWCAPCLAEMPAAAALRRRLAGLGVAFVYVSLDERAADWRRALARPALAAPGAAQLWAIGAFAAPAARAYRVRALPSHWLIGPDGRILDPHPPAPAADSGAALEAALRSALKPSRPPGS